MEISSTSTRPPERDPTNSPHSNGSSSSATPPHTPTPTPTPKPSRSHEPNPYPTTFVQADTSTFKQVVQMLTGSSDNHKADPSPRAAGIPPIKSTAQKKQGFKLYERRNSLKNGLMINTFIPPPHYPAAAFSPRSRNPEILSPSILDFPSLLLSPVTPMNEDRSAAAADQEEKAIAQKKFYFHPSPRADADPPQLLPLFPLTSPRLSGAHTQ